MSSPKHNKTLRLFSKKSFVHKIKQTDSVPKNLVPGRKRGRPKLIEKAAAIIPDADDSTS